MSPHSCPCQETSPKPSLGREDGRQNRERLTRVECPNITGPESEASQVVIEGDGLRLILRVSQLRKLFQDVVCCLRYAPWCGRCHGRYGALLSHSIAAAIRCQ